MSMVRYLLKRLLSAVPILFGLVTLTFFLVHLAPGDPAAVYLSPDIAPEVAEQLAKRFGLNDPLHIQYLKWLGNLSRADLGISFRFHRPVAEVLAEAIPPTLLLSGSALIVELILGISLGLFMAAKRGTVLDSSLTVALLFFYSMPAFWLALLFVLVFSLQLGWLPSSQMHSLGAEFSPTLAYVIDLLKHMVLPVGVLAVRYTAVSARYMRAGVLETLTEPYILTARAKGLDEASVLKRHALRNASAAIVTISGLEFGFLLSGALIIEVIFAWPGMGRVIVDALFARDYPLIVGTTLVAGMMVLLGNLLADIALAVVDPRVRLGRRTVRR